MSQKLTKTTRHISCLVRGQILLLRSIQQGPRCNLSTRTGPTMQHLPSKRHIPQQTTARA